MQPQLPYFILSGWTVFYCHGKQEPLSPTLFLSVLNQQSGQVLSHAARYLKRYFSTLCCTPKLEQRHCHVREHLRTKKQSCVLFGLDKHMKNPHFCTSSATKQSAYVTFWGGGVTCKQVSPALNYTAAWSLSKPTSGIGLDNWMPCCSNFGYFVYNPIIETVQDHRAGMKEGKVKAVIL